MYERVKVHTSDPDDPMDTSRFLIRATVATGVTSIARLQTCTNPAIAAIYQRSERPHGRTLSKT